MRIDALHRVIDALNDSDMHTGYVDWFSSTDFRGLLFFALLAFKLMSALWVLGQKI